MPEVSFTPKVASNITFLIDLSPPACRQLFWIRRIDYQHYPFPCDKFP